MNGEQTIFSQGDNPTLVVAVSGGIGSGKSTVCRFLADLGAQVFDADDVAKKTMREDPQVRSALVEAFGSGSFTPDGRLDRSYLASRVFASEAARSTINTIVHPRVHEAFVKMVDAAAETGIHLVVHESALAPEIPLNHFDAVVIVESPLSKRLERVVHRDGSPKEQVEARVAHQPTDAAFREIADYLIENNGTIEDLRHKVYQLYSKVLLPMSQAANTPPRPDVERHG